VWRGLRRLLRLRPPAEAPAPLAFTAPSCQACGAALELRLPPPHSMLQPVYLGVVCDLCAWVECKTCKGSPSDAPCRICGSPVSPAHRARFAADQTADRTITP